MILTFAVLVTMIIDAVYDWESNIVVIDFCN